MRKVDVGVALIFLSGITAVIDAQPTWNRACSNSESQCFQPDVCSYRLWFPRNKNAECPALGELVNQQERLETLEQRLAEMTIQIAELRRQPETVGRNMTKACLSGWHHFNDRCYLVNSDRNTWHEAYELCYNAGGRLAIVDGEDVNTFLKALIENRLCWIGLHDMRLEDQWQWINGRSAIYSNWASGEPNNAFNNEHCAHIMGSRDGLWNDMRCTYPIGCELCEYNTGCGIGWHNFGHKCYNVSSEYFTWNEAYTACEQLGRQLVRVNSEDVNAFLVELTRNRGGPFWIGLNDAAAEGEWRWTDGSMLTLSNWSPGQQNDTNSGGNCALFQGTAGFWEVAGCSESYQIICEKFVE